jgi:transcriptional regulator with XRE-family HTH domain
MSHRTAYNRERNHHFIKQWRKHRGYTQGQLAEMIGTSVPNLSRIETFQQPYTQDFLEAAADALMTDPASLIIRNPLESEAIWSIWDQASPG